MTLWESHAGARTSLSMAFRLSCPQRPRQNGVRGSQEVKKEDRMNDIEFRQWCSSIPDLTSQQIRVVVNLFGRQGQDITAPKNIPQEDWLLPGINQALMDRGLLTKASERFSRRGIIFDRYRKVSKAVREDLERLLRGQLGRKLKSSDYIMYGLAVGNVMINWCDKRHMSPSRGVVIVNLTHCIEALEEAYPGYIASGMLPAAIGVTDGKIVRTET